jgi:hypothetical protein
MTSGFDLVVKSGFLYVPLVFDPTVEREIGERPGRDGLIEADGRFFVKALSLQSVLDNYEAIDPEGFREREIPGLGGGTPTAGVGEMSFEGKLGTILFGVMPRFVRRRKGFRRGRLGEEEILDLIAEKIRIPPKYHEEAARLADTDFLRRSLRDLEDREIGVDPPGEGKVPADALREWILRALTARAAKREKERLRRMLELWSGPAEASGKRAALRLYIAGEGSLEVDGFGFLRIGAADEYFVYKRTGEYALKDYFGRLYLFPDCRVAVSTVAPLRPFVMETYRHPFLESYDSGQPICLRHFDPPRLFSAAAVVRALEEGINALLRGYSSRRRNGYRSLDPMPRHVVAAPDDDGVPWPFDGPAVRGRGIPHIDFEDYRIPRDHPGIASGTVEVTNDLTP